jgi:hypothetical protein
MRRGGYHAVLPELWHPCLRGKGLEGVVRRLAFAVYWD